ncbi:hypothetical protein B0H13DRAFT_1898697 [Mycena leptocephala]|nr:hypothetical protein B0H13DRAFT_1898697 [Mycena leptocephala]
MTSQQPSEKSPNPNQLLDYTATLANTLREVGDGATVPFLSTIAGTTALIVESVRHPYLSHPGMWRYIPGLCKDYADNTETIERVEGSLDLRSSSSQLGLRLHCHVKACGIQPATMDGRIQGSSEAYLDDIQRLVFILISVCLITSCIIQFTFKVRISGISGTIPQPHASRGRGPWALCPLSFLLVIQRESEFSSEVDSLNLDPSAQRVATENGADSDLQVSNWALSGLRLASHPASKTTRRSPDSGSEIPDPTQGQMCGKNTKYGLTRPGALGIRPDSEEFVVWVSRADFKMGPSITIRDESNRIDVRVNDREAGYRADKVVSLHAHARCSRRDASVDREVMQAP